MGGLGPGRYRRECYGRRGEWLRIEILGGIWGAERGPNLGWVWVCGENTIMEGKKGAWCEEAYLRVVGETSGGQGTGLGRSRRGSLALSGWH